MMPTADSLSIAEVPLDEFAAPRVLLIGQPETRAAGLAAIRNAGAGLAGPYDIVTATQQVANNSFSAVLVELGVSDDPEAVDALLEAVEQAAATRGQRGVAVMPPGLLDLAHARLAHPAVTLLCDPTPAERALELALTLAAPVTTPLVKDRTSDGALRLRQLSEEVGRIARTLASLSVNDAPVPHAANEEPASSLDAGGAVDASAYRAIIRSRRLRAQFFDDALFADPAWDMLLDLAAARLEGTAVAVSSLCIAAAVPPTTALRWIKTLTDAGLLVRVADPRDRRRVFIELDERVARKMNAYLAAAQRITPLLI